MSDLVRASRVEAKPIDWLIPDLIPAGMFCDIAGRPGEGKSTLECWLTAEVTRNVGPVIVSNQEDPIEQVLIPRLEAAGAMMRRVHLAEEPILIPDHLDRLEQRIRQTKARLVIFDAAQQHFTVPVSDGQSVRRATTPLGKMLARTGCAAVFIDHVKKNVSGNAHPLEALIGAGSGLAAAARLVYLFGTSPTNPEERILATAKSNIGRARSVLFELMEREIVLAPRDSNRIHAYSVGQMQLLDLDCKLTAHDVLRYNGNSKGNAGGHGARAAARAIASEWLLALLMGGPVKQSELQAEAATCGISWATVRRAADELTIVKKREGFGKGGFWTWALPDDHPVLALAAQAGSPGGTS